MALFVKKDIEVKDFGEVFIHQSAKERDSYSYEDEGNHPRNIQYATLKRNDEVITVLNFHGLWTGAGKSDTRSRIAQSEKIIDLMSHIETPKVLCGDFNLEPDTKSVALIEGVGMVNLVREHGVTSTRTSFYKKPIRFADYIFVEGVTTEGFKVLPDEVSDHAALEVSVAV